MITASASARRLWLEPESAQGLNAACRLFISQHPEIEARILHELQELGVYSDVQGKPSRALTYADIQKLTYLQCVIKVRAHLIKESMTD